MQFLRYEALRWAEGITPRDKDPEGYVEEQKTDEPSAVAEKAARDAEEAATTGPARTEPSLKASEDADVD